MPRSTVDNLWEGGATVESGFTGAQEIQIGSVNEKDGLGH